MFKLCLEKAEEPEFKLPVFIGDHSKGRRIPGKKIYVIEYTKVFDCVDHNKCGKFLKSWEYRTTLPASWDPYMQVRKQQLELEMKERTGSKLGKEYIRLYIVTLLI